MVVLSPRTVRLATCIFLAFLVSSFYSALLAPPPPPPPPATLTIIEAAVPTQPYGYMTSSDAWSGQISCGKG